jgi:hypothetical protein
MKNAVTHPKKAKRGLKVRNASTKQGKGKFAKMSGAKPLASKMHAKKHGKKY